MDKSTSTQIREIDSSRINWNHPLFALAKPKPKTTSATLEAAIIEAVSDFGEAAKEATKNPTLENGKAAVAAAEAACEGLDELRKKYTSDDEMSKIDAAEAQVRGQQAVLEEVLERFSSVLDENSIAEHKAKVLREIRLMAEAVSSQYEEVLNRGHKPFAYGPTGCGKSWGAKLLAERLGCGLEYRAGTETTTSADLVGTPLPGGILVPGVIARAFDRARKGETILLVLDEIPRYPQRALDVILPAMDPVSPATAKAMGIRDAYGNPPTEDIYLVEEALWGKEWAPASKIKFLLAGNPWGNPVDPALASRTEPFEVTYPEALRNCFSDEMSKVIESSWVGARPGGTISVPLPIDPRALSETNGPNDTSLITRYVQRLNLCDSSGATGEAFERSAVALGVKL